jgi:hypothetical protein
MRPERRDLRARMGTRRLALLLLPWLLAACSVPHGVPLVSRAPTPTATPTATATVTPPPTPTAVPKPSSWLAGETILSMYGRAFNTLPILGRLGMDANMNALEVQARPFAQGIASQNGNKPVRIALHLIYGMATPCDAGAKCLNYLDDTGVNIVKQYILPAARRGWLVILDDQLGSSTPAAEVQRIIAKGYLNYDNVAIGLDPEFHLVPGEPVPGIPVGSVTAASLNAAEFEINSYARAHPLAHRKVLLIHQFQFGMIQQRGSLHLHLPWVDPVLIMDGFGDPGVKAHVYHDLFGPQAAPRLRNRGIKLFYPNQYETAGHGDGPLMTWAQVFGHAPALDIDGRDYWVHPAPQMVVIA